ncbi:MAG: hypothetical protein PCFJNLEI_01550 [Verrucomicrobiae bacterium]|nr:hypothetical protein [Verrucomicrobiae bacterium]
MPQNPKIGPSVRTFEQSEARFRLLFEHSPDAIFVESLTGEVLDANAAACRLHGLERHELIGKNVVDLVPAAQRAEVRRSFPQLAQRTGETLAGESLHADGRSIPVELRKGVRGSVLSIGTVPSRR